MEWMAPGLNVGYTEKHPIYPDFDEFATRPYYLYSEYIRPQSVSTITYPAQGSAVTATKKIFYQNKKHLFPTLTETNRSDGGSTFQYVLYPQDYQPTSFVTSMIDSNVLELPIETVELADTANLGPIISGKITRYRSDFPAVADSFFAFEATYHYVPGGTQFKFSNALTGQTPFLNAGLSFGRDSRYVQKAVVTQLDSKANILTYREADSITTTNIWDYRQQQVIASVRFASNAEAAYTSFEADGTGNWVLTDTARYRTDARTGRQAYTLASGIAITKSGLPSGKAYIVSYWSKSGAVSVNGITGVSGMVKNGWTCWTHQLPTTTTSVTVTGSGQIIDELRLSPARAVMTTFTYDPQVGATTQTDANNRSVFYEYDGLGRLKTVRDNDRNILKMNTYQYQAQ